MGENATVTANNNNGNKKSLLSLLTEPIQWVRMLSSQLHPTFVIGVFVVYGLGPRPLGLALQGRRRLLLERRAESATLHRATLRGLVLHPLGPQTPLGDPHRRVPVRGYRRRPYFVIAGVLGTVSAAAVALEGNLAAAAALLCFLGVSASLAIADVTIDACIARNSIEVRALAPDLQSLCGFCSAPARSSGTSPVGSSCTILVPRYKTKPQDFKNFVILFFVCAGSLGLMALAPALTIVLGFVIYENRASGLHTEKKQVEEESVGMKIRSMYQTMMYPQVWKPSLYMFLALALSVTTHEGHFYWYTDPRAGPAFSQEFVGMIYAIGAVASLIGVVIYHKALKDYSFRDLVFYAQLFYGISGVLDLIFILRWNLVIGIPDYFFVVIEESATRITGKIRWMPMMVLSTQLCPLGIEGTFFALLMCIDSIGALFSRWGGGVLLRLLHVTRTDFTNLWLAVLIRDMLRFATLALVFLVPKAGQYEGLLPSEILEKNASDNVEEEALELVPINGKTEV
ncbi:folate-biopterin transporter 6 [Spatholobus suberectus]|nr:folate-biopterin transporter 6 [Spatholobus suberectus]